MAIVLPVVSSRMTLKRQDRSGPRPPTYGSEYSSNFRRRLPYLRICRLTCDFAARWFALFAAGDPCLTEQRRNRRASAPCLLSIASFALTDEVLGIKLSVSLRLGRGLNHRLCNGGGFGIYFYITSLRIILCLIS